MLQELLVQDRLLAPVPVHLLVQVPVHRFLLYQDVHFLLVLNYLVLAVQPFRQTDFRRLK